MKHQHFSAFLLIGLLASTANANPQQNVTVTGSIPATMQLHAKVKRELAASAPQSKQISLQKIILSDKAAAYLSKHAKAASQHVTVASATLLSSKAQLGMNKVPVLDQGKLGTCVTFADTAAIDAIYGKGDYISQLCNLDLGSTLEPQAGIDQNGNAVHPSGWNGSSNPVVMKQIHDYGVVSKKYQLEHGCGDRNDKVYPLDDGDFRGVPLSVEEFLSVSESTKDSIFTREILNSDNAFSEETDMEVVLNNVKKALSNGHRVVFGTLLDLNDEMQYIMGALGTYNNIPNVSWVYSDKIMQDLIANVKAKKPLAGHAMIITGYNDQAVVMDMDGIRHKGVLTLRNSWSSDAGDNGNYYMSYDYFTQLVQEVVEISPTPFN